MKELSLADLDKLDVIDLEKEDINNMSNWYINNINNLRKNYNEIKDPFEEVVILYDSNLIYKNGDIFCIYCYDKKN